MNAFAVILLFAAGTCAVPCVLDGQEPSVADRYPGNCTYFERRLNCCPTTEANAPKNFEAALIECGTLSDLCFNEMKGALCDAVCNPMQGQFTDRAFRPRICHDYANFLFVACLADNFEVAGSCVPVSAFADGEAFVETVLGFECNNTACLGGWPGPAFTNGASHQVPLLETIAEAMLFLLW